MDLKTFVTETLTQIADGIKAAQEQQEKRGAIFSPCHYTYGKKAFLSTDANGNHNNSNELQAVDFDVALTVSNNVSGGAKAGLEVMGVSLLGAKAEVAQQNETVSHVKFNVFVSWPRCK